MTWRVTFEHPWRPIIEAPSKSMRHFDKNFEKLIFYFFAKVKDNHLHCAREDILKRGVL